MNLLSHKINGKEEAMKLRADRDAEDAPGSSWEMLRRLNACKTPQGLDIDIETWMHNLNVMYLRIQTFLVTSFQVDGLRHYD